MAPGRGLQTFYDSTLPEAVEIKSSEYSSDNPSDDATPTRRPNRKKMIIILIVIVVIAAALGLGLGLGLRRKDKDDDNINQSAGSAPGVPSATDPAFIMANTPIAAITLPNNSRHIYFQKKSGAFRRAIYSPQASLWQASADSRLATNAKPNTPLAVARWLDYRDRVNVSTASRLYGLCITVLAVG